MKMVSVKTRFDKSGYYFIGLIALALLGFWKSYFSVFFTNDYAFYFHFHAAMISLWVIMLIVQPILIRKGKLHAHRIIGKLSYIVMPLLLLSILLMNNFIGKLFPGEADFMRVLGRGFIPLSVLFIIAIWRRHNVNIHARAMISTGIFFIEPALIRFLFGFHIPPPTAFYITMVVTVVVLIALIIIERNQKSGRWVFPLTLCMYLIVGNVTVRALNPFTEWVIQLPLTPGPTFKDNPIPQNEIGAYTGEWQDGSITFEKNGQLWMRSMVRGRIDTTRLLSQGNNQFVGEKVRPLSLYFKVKDGKAQAFNSYFAYIYRATIKRKK